MVLAIAVGGQRSQTFAASGGDASMLRSEALPGGR